MAGLPVPPCVLEIILITKHLYFSPSLRVSLGYNGISLLYSLVGLTATLVDSGGLFLPNTSIRGEEGGTGAMEEDRT